MKLKTMIYGGLVSVAAFLFTLAMIAQVWVSIFFPPVPRYNIMRLLIK